MRITGCLCYQIGIYLENDGLLEHAQQMAGHANSRKKYVQRLFRCRHPLPHGEPDNQGIYEVTVRRATDNEVLFVDPAGRLVRQQTLAVASPVQTTRPIVTETVTEESSTPGVNTFVRSLDNDRYQLIEKKDDKEVYRDKETGTKWVVEVHRKGD